MISTTTAQIGKTKSVSIAYKLNIHALSHYNITVYPNLIEISFIAENYKDINKKRIINKQFLSVRKDSNMGTKTFSIIENDVETIIHSSDGYTYQFNELFKIIYPSIQNIYRSKKILNALEREKRLTSKSDTSVINRLNTEIKFHKDEKRNTKRLLKNTLFNLF